MSKRVSPTVKQLWEETNISLRTIAVNLHKQNKITEYQNNILIEIERRLCK